MRRLIPDRALGLVGVAVVLIAWEIGGRILGEMLFAPPSKVIPALVLLILDGRILIELATTVGQMLIGFALACLVGFPLGVVMGRMRLVDALVHPWVSMLVVTSMAAIVPVAMLLLGTGLSLRIFIVFAGSVGYLVLTSYHGVQDISARYVNAARSFSISGFGIYRTILIPGLYPYAITGIRLGLIHALRAMIMAEMFVITGFGGLIYQAGMDITVTYMMSYILLLMLFSVLATSLVEYFGHKSAPWYRAKAGLTR